MAGDSSPTGVYVRVPKVSPDDTQGADGLITPSPSVDSVQADLPEVSGYRILREIARGGMGCVLAALDLALNREVALKVLLPGTSADRFVRESLITAHLPHPGIPPVYALGRLADGSPFLAMKLVAGRNLGEELKAEGRADLVGVFGQICQAVGFAHSRNIVHRDLKPANVMVGAFGEVLVMDWGLAKQLGTAEVDDTQAGAAGKLPEQTLAGSVMGTPAYLAPEQARGEAVDARADVFALGGILSTILTGQPPFVGQSMTEVLQRAAAAELEEAHARLDRCGAHAELVSLCRRCLSPRPADRPADGNAVAEAVATYRTGVEERLRQADRERAAAEARTIELAKRRKVQAVLAVLTVVLLAGVAGTVGAYRMQQATVALRRANTITSVHAALEDVSRRSEEAWQLADDPERMQTAATLAQDAFRRAEGFVNTGEPTPDLHAELASTREALADLDRHVQLFVNADRLLREHAEQINTDYDVTSRGLDKAFRAFGLDLTDTKESTRIIIASRTRDQLLGLVDHVFFLTKKRQYNELFLSVQRAAGGVLGRWQEVTERGDIQGLVALADSPEVLTLGPGLLLRLGRNLRDARQDEAAIHLLRRATDRYPRDVWLNYDMGWTHHRRKQALPAIRHYSVAWAQRPDSAFLLGYLGRAYRDAGDSEQAIDCYRKAIQLGPAIAWLRTDIAQTYQSTGRTREALPHLAAESALNPKNTFNCMKVAALQAWFGQDEELAATRRRILAFTKVNNDLNTAERAAKVWSLVPSNDKAERETAQLLGRKGVARAPGKWSLLTLGMAEYRANNDPAAQTALLAAAKAGSDEPAILSTVAFFRAMSLFRQGKEEAGRRLAIAAAAKMKPLPTDEQNPLANEATPDDLVLWMAYKEARALIQFDAVPPPRGKNDKE